MYSQYQRSKKNIVYKKVKIEDFLQNANTDKDPNILPLNVATSMYNFDAHNGALTTGMGLKTLYLPHVDDPEHLTRIIDEFPYDIEKVWVYRYYDYMGNDWSMVVAYCVDHHLYSVFLQAIDTTPSKETRFSLSSCPVAVNYRLNGQDVFILCTKQDGMIIWDANYANNAPIFVEDAPKISSMCLQFDKLFACLSGDKSQVWYSDDLDPTNWNVSMLEAGFLTMIDEKGRLNKVMSFKDYVYVFRDYGISRIAKTNQGFEAEQLYQSNSRIYPDSVVVAGDCFILLMEDGLYRFDGLNYEKIDFPLMQALQNQDNTKAEGVFHNGCYYLACNMDYPDPMTCETGNFNTLLQYDLETGKIALLRGVGIMSICACHDDTFSKLLVVCKHNGKQVCTVLEEDGQFFDQPLPKKWVSPMIDLDLPDKEKMIQEIYLTSRYDCQMVISTDKKTKKFFVKGSDKPQTIKIHMKGKIFGITFECQDRQAYISAPTILVGYYQ